MSLKRQLGAFETPIGLTDISKYYFNRFKYLVILNTDSLFCVKILKKRCPMGRLLRGTMGRNPIKYSSYSSDLF